VTRGMKGFVTLLAIAVFAAATILSAVDVPYLTGRVVDEANIIRPETRARLTTVLKNHEDSTGNQVVVLTVPTIQPESIEDYAVKVFAAWKLGQKGKDNGVLVIVVPQDRKVRIEVGYGLEPTLTDGACGQIIRGVMTPRFKEGDYDRGIEDGVAAIIGRLEGRPDVARAVDTRARSRLATNFAPGLPWPQRILFGVFTFSIIGLFTVLGVMTPGGGGWFLYVFLIPFWTMFPMAIVGSIQSLVLLAAYVVGYPIAKVMVGRTDWYKKAAADLKTKGTANIGGFVFNSSAPGFSSGGFSSGGFSGGGGGSSGGGGASGSW
jgi:uncharacterized protein